MGRSVLVDHRSNHRRSTRSDFLYATTQETLVTIELHKVMKTKGLDQRDTTKGSKVLVSSLYIHLTAQKFYMSRKLDFNLLQVFVAINIVNKTMQ